MPSVRQVSVTTSTTTSDSANLLMEQVVEQGNMQRAWSRVKSNKGCAGVDGLDIGQTAVCLKDRWPQIKQQVLGPLFDPGFSESSFGFRPGRSAHMAVGQCQRYCDVGYRWVVDMDLEKFFDRVNHDILMSKIIGFWAS